MLICSSPHHDHQIIHVVLFFATVQTSMNLIIYLGVCIACSFIDRDSLYNASPYTSNNVMRYCNNSCTPMPPGSTGIGSSSNPHTSILLVLYNS